MTETTFTKGEHEQENPAKIGLLEVIHPKKGEWTEISKMKKKTSLKHQVVGADIVFVIMGRGG